MEHNRFNPTPESPEVQAQALAEFETRRRALAQADQDRFDTIGLPRGFGGLR